MLGLLPVYELYLREKMIGHSLLVHLSKTSEALQAYAGHLDCCENLPQEACTVMKTDNVLRFKHAKEKIIIVVTEYMTNAKDSLFDHDAKEWSTFIERTSRLIKPNRISNYHWTIEHSVQTCQREENQSLVPFPLPTSLKNQFLFVNGSREGTKGNLISLKVRNRVKNLTQRGKFV